SLTIRSGQLRDVESVPVFRRGSSVSCFGLVGPKRAKDCHRQAGRRGSCQDRGYTVQSRKPLRRVWSLDRAKPPNEPSLRRTGSTGFLHLTELDLADPRLLVPAPPLKPRMEQLFQCGQEVNVQVITPGEAGKGATLSTYLNLAGRYVILHPSLKQHGASRQIE